MPATTPAGSRNQDQKSKPYVLRLSFARSLAACRVFFRVVRRCSARLLIALLVVSLLLPPAPILAAGRAEETSAVDSAADVNGVAAQEEPPPAEPTGFGDPSEPAPALLDLPIEDPAAIPVPAPAAPPAVGEPEPPLVSLTPAPVLLRVLSRQAVVSAGAPFTVTMRVSPAGSDTPLPEGLALSVQLPAGVALAPESAGAPLTFAVPPLAAGEKLSQTLTLVADGSRPLLGIEAAVSGASVWTRWKSTGAATGARAGTT